MFIRYKVCLVAIVTYFIRLALPFDDNSSLALPFLLPTQAAGNDDKDLYSISSDPARICFCKDTHPACGHQWPLVTVKKGYCFTITLAAVDQVNRTVNATIRSFLSSSGGGLGEGQQSQNAYEMCTNLTFNVFSQLQTEKLIC